MHLTALLTCFVAGCRQRGKEKKKPAYRLKKIYIYIGGIYFTGGNFLRWRREEMQMKSVYICTVSHQNRPNVTFLRLLYFGNLAFFVSRPPSTPSALVGSSNDRHTFCLSRCVDVCGALVLRGNSKRAPRVTEVLIKTKREDVKTVRKRPHSPPSPQIQPFPAPPPSLQPPQVQLGVADG